MSTPASIVPRTLVDKIPPSLQEEVNFFLKWGYLIVDNALPQEQLRGVTSAFEECLENKDREFTHQLIEEDERFDCLLDNPPIMQRMKAILGNCLQLHSATARVTRPGASDQAWHRDGPWPVSPEGTPYGSLPGQINCAYYLDELTTENGPLVILPGSQRVPFGPPAGHVEFGDQKLVFARPGQAIIFDGWLFHRGGANTSTANRRVCLMCYQNAWMKSRENFDSPRIKKLREGGSPERQLLLGGITSW
jgi:hypothetical protein